MARENLLHIDDGLCQVCRKCEAAKACNVRAIIDMDPDEAPYLDVRRCYDCRICIPACPYGAVILRPLS